MRYRNTYHARRWWHLLGVSLDAGETADLPEGIDDPWLKPVEPETKPRKPEAEES